MKARPAVQWRIDCRGFIHDEVSPLLEQTNALMGVRTWSNTERSLCNMIAADIPVVLCRACGLLGAFLGSASPRQWANTQQVVEIMGGETATLGEYAHRNWMDRYSVAQLLDDTHKAAADVDRALHSLAPDSDDSARAEAVRVLQAALDQMRISLLRLILEVPEI
jgi:hypothetical protein